MSVLNPNSDEEPLECPLCMEYLELDDINFFPCSCGYQVKLFFIRKPSYTLGRPDFFDQKKVYGKLVKKSGRPTIHCTAFLYSKVFCSASVTTKQVKVVSRPERIDVFLTRSCVQVTDISCGVMYEATLESLVLFKNYCYVTTKTFLNVCLRLFWAF